MDNDRKVGWVENDSHIAFDQKFPAEKGNGCCRDEIASSFVVEVQDEIFSHFHE
jgi:hypothetical protein